LLKGNQHYFALHGRPTFTKKTTNKIVATLLAPILKLTHNKKGDDHEL
jgi:hypothetical protein